MGVGKKILKVAAKAKKFHFKYEGAGVPEGVVGLYYPAEDVVLKKGLPPVRNPPKLRASITPGTVLILLAGRFRGKRVVFLKQLASGLLLVSGPYGINGVPLRRVNQKYVIATSTTVDLKGVDASKIDDALFARTEGDAANPGTPKAERISKVRAAAQAGVEKGLLANIKKVEMLGDYLKCKFSLSKSDKPHTMLF